jgi:hypothetical protein
LKCAGTYCGNIKELKLINQFQREYRSEEVIRWYAKQSFIYKLINKALISEDILTVYRRIKLDKEEFGIHKRIKENSFQKMDSYQLVNVNH